MKRPALSKAAAAVGALHKPSCSHANSAQLTNNLRDQKSGEFHLRVPTNVLSSGCAIPFVLALKLQSRHPMKSYVHEVVRRLMELAGLEERLAALSPRNREERTNVEALIESLRGNVPMGVLIAHDQMRNRSKRSVAEVRNGVCSGCHLALAVGNVHGLKSGSLHRCGNCGRFLYVVEEVEEGAEPPLPPARPPKLLRKTRQSSTSKPEAKSK